MLGVNWMDELGLKLNMGQAITTIKFLFEDEDVKDLTRKFEELFTENHTLELLEVDIELIQGVELVQQKSRPLPIHLQSAVEKELKTLNWKTIQ